ncbi:uncharacterized protein EV420DRAFT_1645867 [Desarmillaria tabescens]|uniref:Uncharacterized protein n=1 Tax=Armillaria tabescens TaxID=1929756 RepID=A0AA39K072_ARMTA|nr:uncharacterized protein EV420DRAFT_1645867 [Desarmillaria tabescens]KAK0451958.1 hypothetical protein EV420DRAFT_1645867 [Desarmillaria tabescens]
MPIKLHAMTHHHSNVQHIQLSQQEPPQEAISEPRQQKPTQKQQQLNKEKSQCQQKATTEVICTVQCQEEIAGFSRSQDLYELEFEDDEQGPAQQDDSTMFSTQEAVIPKRNPNLSRHAPSVTDQSLPHPVSLKCNPNLVRRTGVVPLPPSDQGHLDSSGGHKANIYNQRAGWHNQWQQDHTHLLFSTFMVQEREHTILLMCSMIQVFTVPPTTISVETTHVVKSTKVATGGTRGCTQTSDFDELTKVVLEDAITEYDLAVESFVLVCKARKIQMDIENDLMKLITQRSDQAR